jgi:pimeloyl-ACP methyl ester carboxylesterase
MQVEPFTAQTPQSVLDDLRDRLGRTRWPDQVEGQPWRWGTERGFLQRVCAHWGGSFDWRAAEARLNALPQFRVVIEGTGLHFVHVRSGQPDAVPLLLTNGWPSSIFEYLDLIPRLAAAGFDVVAPALPGYGYSDRPAAPGMNMTRIAALFAALMEGLGYTRFLAHGSDMGAGVLEQMRRRHADRLRGIHFSNVYWGYPRPDDPTPEEQAYLGRVQGWTFTEGAYAMLQGTKPQTLSYGLNDSPAGLSAWILEKFEAWTDGGAEAAIGLDGLCANLTLYWVTETIGSSVRLYAEAFADGAAQAPPERGQVPVGVTVSPKDILPAPRAWGERWLNVVYWSEAPRGGHFPAWEQPDLLARELRAFADKLR